MKPSLLRAFVTVFDACCAAALACGADLGTRRSASAAKLRALPTEARVWKGDFDGMLERRHIRVLVPFSRTLFYNDKGRERGITAETARDFEQYLNKKYAAQLGKRPITVYLVPTTRDELLRGRGQGPGRHRRRQPDGDRRAQADRRLRRAGRRRSRTARSCSAGRSRRRVATAEALSGKTVHVRWTSSYHDSLVALNQRLQKDGKPAVKLVDVPDELEDEDMMEMLNVGLLDYIVVDDWKARMWAQVLPKIVLNEGAVVREGGPGRLGDAQGQPQAGGRAERVLHQPPEEAGRGQLPHAAAHRSASRR